MDLEKQNDMPEQEENLAVEETAVQEPENEAVLEQTVDGDEGITEAEETAEEKTENEAEKKNKMPKKKKNGRGLPMWATVCISVLAVAAIVLGALFAVDHFKKPFKSYTASEKKLISAQNTVVATAGEHKLTNAELSVYYWTYIYTFLDENSYYLSYLGLDYTKDFSEQACYFDKEISWQQYFLENTLSGWHQYITLYGAAEEAGFALPESEQEYLDNLKATLDEQAKKYGYADGGDMVQKEMSIGATWDAYEKYSKETFVGMGYYSQFAKDVKLTEEDIAKQYADNIEEYKENKIALKDEYYCASVRHILLMPEATKDENGKDVYTDAAWAACKEKAEKLLEEYLKKGKIDEEAFAALAKEHTEDGGSKSNGGLYTDFTRGKMVEEFEAWSFDASRKYGDTGLVKSTYGYHIMFFVDGDDTFSTSVRHILLMPEATKDEDGKDVYTDAAWAACKEEAEKLLKEYLKKGKIDEEAFAALAKEHTEDGGSKADGGLYADFTRGKMVEEFEAWSFDDARKYGDTGLVKSTYGYHIMFFVDSKTEWQSYADYTLRMEACKALLNSLKEKSPLDVDYNKIVLGHVNLGS